jgi:hypothetical protein
MNPIIREGRNRHPVYLGVRGVASKTFGSATPVEPPDPSFPADLIEQGLKVPNHITFFREAFTSHLLTEGSTPTEITINEDILEGLSFNRQLEELVVDNATKQIRELSSQAREAVAAALGYLEILTEPTSNAVQIA